MALPDAWTERAYVEIERFEAGSATEISGAIDLGSLDIDQGDRDFDKVDLLNLGQIIKATPEDMTTISFDMYSTDFETDEDVGVFFLGGTTSPASTGGTLYAGTDRYKFRVAILFTNDPNVTAAGSSVNTGTATSYAARRLVFVDAYVTSWKTSYTDGIHKISVNFKLITRGKIAGDNGANIAVQRLSGDTTSTLAALGTYTGTGTTRF